MKQNSNVMIKAAFVVFILIGIFTVARMEIKYNGLNEQRRQLEAESAALAEKIEDAREEWNRPFDTEYVADVAQEKLNLCFPEEILFYSDLTN